MMQVHLLSVFAVLGCWDQCFLRSTQAFTTTFTSSKAAWRRRETLTSRTLLRDAPPASNVLDADSTVGAENNKNNPLFFASIVERERSPKFGDQTRILGSQELLMLPRQYAPNPNVKFPQLNHVSCAILSQTPSEFHLRKAIDDVIQAHPLLRCRVEGDGEPDERIDLMKMVRKGDPNPCTFVSKPDLFTSKDVLRTIDVKGRDTESLEKSWREAFRRDLDDGSWCNTEKGPLWKLEWHRPSTGTGPCAILLSFNHAISDQSSANRIINQLLENIATLESFGYIRQPAEEQKIPLAVEDSVLGENGRWSDVQLKGMSGRTISYVAAKASEGSKSPVIVPDSKAKGDGGGVFGALSIIFGKAAGGEDADSVKRSTALQFRRLSKAATTALLEKCRENGVAVTNALSAAVTLTATDFIDNGTKKGISRNYKVLESLDMRRFGAQLDKGETVACMAGSMDLMHGPLPDHSGEALRVNPTKERLEAFWKLAKEGKEQTSQFIDSNGPVEAVRVFDFAMSVSDMNNLVHLTAQSKDSQGRAYSAGVTNVGVFEKQTAFRRSDEKDRRRLQTKHGRYELKDVVFATSHARTGCLYQVSGQTIGGELSCTFNPAMPLVSEETNAQFADAFMDVLEIVAGTKQPEKSDVAVSSSAAFSFQDNAFALACAALGVVAVASHGQAWLDFFGSVAEMKSNIEDPEDFWAALNFWIFFAAGHTILPPILWISDVLHGSPGPKVADLVPISFIAGNVAAITAFATSKQIRNAVNIAALAAFFTYIGAGLDGKAGLGDYNLALDDPYQGQIVKGCPAYEEVRQPSMDSFDLKKYQGTWYEQKFHDWTQFKEVYDTTLKIELTPDGAGWKDDFAVKGPAPNAAPLSWDKSPVANGAHYFLFGRVDKKDPPGVLRESGFGVEFPNYIVDVKKDPVTGEYTEAIQFQCLERGGVRVFEGINFMSRKPQMSEPELEEMHARAKKAGMFPYGASPEQMHSVARRPEGAPEVDNEWQAMWRQIGVDRLLELLTESIEDGGR